MVNAVHWHHRQHRAEVITGDQRRCSAAIRHHHRPHPAIARRFHHAAQASGTLRKRCTHLLHASIRLARTDQSHRPRTGRQGRQFRQERAIARAIHQHASRRHAGLSGVHRDGEPDPRRSLSHIRVCQNDRRIMSAEFEHRRHQARGRRCRHGRTHARATREHHLVEHSLAHEPLARLGGRVRKRKPSVRQSTRRRQSHEQLLGMRRTLRGLHRDPIARHHRLHQLHPQQAHRIVPCRDDQHMPKRRTTHAGTATQQPRGSTRCAVHTQHPARMSGVPAHRRKQRQHLAHVRLALRLAYFIRDHLGDLATMGRQRAAERRKPALPDRPREPRLAIHRPILIACLLHLHLRPGSPA